MLQKDFRKLSRTDLLEILLAQAEEIERLQMQCAKLQEELDQRRIVAGEAGSIADASLKLNAVFEAAQAAADEYLKNIRVQGERLASEEARQLLIETEKRCMEMERKTVAKCDAMLHAILNKDKDGKKSPFCPDEYIW